MIGNDFYTTRGGSLRTEVRRGLHRIHLLGREFGLVCGLSGCRQFSFAMDINPHSDMLRKKGKFLRKITQLAFKQKKYEFKSFQ